MTPEALPGTPGSGGERGLPQPGGEPDAQVIAAADVQLRQAEVARRGAELDEAVAAGLPRTPEDIIWGTLISIKADIAQGRTQDMDPRQADRIMRALTEAGFVVLREDSRRREIRLLYQERTGNGPV